MPSIKIIGKRGEGVSGIAHKTIHTPQPYRTTLSLPPPKEESGRREDTTRRQTKEQRERRNESKKSKDALPVSTPVCVSVRGSKRFWQLTIVGLALYKGVEVGGRQEKLMRHEGSTEKREEKSELALSACICIRRCSCGWPLKGCQCKP